MKLLETPRATLSPRFDKAGLRSIGSYLKKRRKAAALSLRNLSDLSGVSVASISALESARSSPSLVTVLGVVDALGLTIDQAIEESSSETRRVVVRRAADLGAWQPAELRRGLGDAALEVQLVTLDPGALLSAPPNLVDAPSLCFVLDGPVITSLSDAARVTLKSGDAYHAQPGKVTSWANAGSKLSRILCVADRTAIRLGPQPARKTP